MTLRDSIQDDALTVFLQVDDFAEEVIYHPGNGSARNIKAVVIRESQSQMAEIDGVVLPYTVIHVANNATTGISSDELDEGQDQIEFAVRHGQTPQRRTIMELLNQDEGMLELSCR